jgi:hypothetical protein
MLALSLLVLNEYELFSLFRHRVRSAHHQRDTRHTHDTRGTRHSNLLDDLPNELVLLDKLTELKVDGNPMKNIPDADQGGNAVFHFLLKRYKGTHTRAHTTHATHDTRAHDTTTCGRVAYETFSSSSPVRAHSGEEGGQEDDSQMKLLMVAMMVPICDGSSRR